MVSPKAFLNALLCKAIEAKPDFFDIQSFERFDHLIDGPSARIYVPSEEETFNVNVTVMRRGITTLLHCHAPSNNAMLQNGDTEQKLFVSEEERLTVFNANLNNDISMVTSEVALIILQVGLFGQVVF
jgi:hypothetical protein